jgi:hypothetical protein
MAKLCRVFPSVLVMQTAKNWFLRLHVKRTTADQARSDQWLRYASVPECPALGTDEGGQYCNVGPTHEELVADVYC